MLKKTKRSNTFPEIKRCVSVAGTEPLFLLEEYIPACSKPRPTRHPLAPHLPPGLSGTNHLPFPCTPNPSPHLSLFLPLIPGPSSVFSILDDPERSSSFGDAPFPDCALGLPSAAGSQDSLRGSFTSVPHCCPFTLHSVRDLILSPHL